MRLSQEKVVLITSPMYRNVSFAVSPMDVNHAPILPNTLARSVLTSSILCARLRVSSHCPTPVKRSESDPQNQFLRLVQVFLTITSALSATRETMSGMLPIRVPMNLIPLTAVLMTVSMKLPMELSVSHFPMEFISPERSKPMSSQMFVTIYIT